MKTIYKYNIALANEGSLILPKNAVQLSIQNQNGTICLWCIIDPEEKEMENFSTHVVGTGHIVNKDFDECHYQSSVQQGIFVWHVFMKRV